MADLSNDKWESRVLIGPGIEWLAQLRIFNGQTPDIEPRPEDLEAVVMAMKTMIENISPSPGLATTKHIKVAEPTEQTF